MANITQKKKRSTRAAHSTTKRKRRQIRSVAARATTAMRSSIISPVHQAPESGQKTDLQLTERSGEYFRNMFGFSGSESLATQQSAGHPGPVLQAGTIFASGMRSISLALIHFMQERMHQNFTGLLALTHCRTPAQFIAVQRHLARDNVEGLVQSTGRIADISMQMAHEGLRRMGAVSLVGR
jgi:hypothetical protein